MKWYIELPLFALTFFGVTVIFNTLFNFSGVALNRIINILP